MVLVTDAEFTYSLALHKRQHKQNMEKQTLLAPRLHTRPFKARRALPRSVVDSLPSKGEDQNCDLFTGKICPSGLKKKQPKTVQFWQQDEKMTQGNNVGE